MKKVLILTALMLLAVAAGAGVTDPVAEQRGRADAERGAQPAGPPQLVLSAREKKLVELTLLEVEIAAVQRQYAELAGRHRALLNELTTGTLSK